MLKETGFRIENLSKSLADIDVTSKSSWVGVTEFSDKEQSVVFSGNLIKLPEKIRFPFVRSLDEKTALIVDPTIQVLNYEFEDYEPGMRRIVNTTYLNKNNAWIIDFTGAIKANFSVDDAIQDVIVTKDFIVVTQFDEAAIGGDGVCVYDFQGNRLFNYHEVFGANSVEIFDCYAASLVKENQIIFCPYTEFPLVLFDIETKTQRIWKTPDEIHGSDAITMLNDKVYFYSPYSEQTGIFEWQIGSERTEKIGEYSSYLRGLPNGKFLARNNSGYTIISLQ
jgi:hypothetical protein